MDINLLKALEPLNPEGEKTSIVVVDSDEPIRQELAMALAAESLEVRAFDGPEPALAAVSAELRGRVAALVVALEPTDFAMWDFVEALRPMDGSESEHGNFSETPVVATVSGSDYVCDGEPTEAALAVLEQELLDVWVAKPFEAEDIKSAIVRAAKKHSGVLSEAEQAAKNALFQRFIEIYSGVFGEWESFLASLPPGDLYVDTAAQACGPAATGLQALANPGTLDTDTYRRIVHAVRNALGPIPNLTELAPDYEVLLSPEQRARRDALMAEYSQFMADLAKMALVFHNRRDASMVSFGQAAEKQQKQELTNVRDLFFAVVDDSQTVRECAGDVIAAARANAILVDDSESPTGFRDFLSKPHFKEVDVVLLDHEAGKLGNGYDLIDNILEAFPGALVICHTTVATELLADPKNPYHNHLRGRVEIVDKYKWSTISEIIERWRAEKAA